MTDAYTPGSHGRPDAGARSPYTPASPGARPFGAQDPLPRAPLPPAGDVARREPPLPPLPSQRAGDAGGSSRPIDMLRRDADPSGGRVAEVSARLDESSSEGSATAGSEVGEAEAPRRRRKRGSRGGRKRSRKKAEGQDAETRDSDTDADDSAGGDEPEAEEKPRRKRATRKKATRRKKASSSAEEDEPAPDEDEAPEGGRKKRRRTRSRKKAAAADDGEEPEARTDDDTDEGDEEDRPKSRRRKRTRKKAAAKSEEPEYDDDADDADEPEEGEAAATKRTRRGRRGGRRRRKSTQAVAVDMIPGEEDDDLPELPDLPDGAEMIDEPKGRSRKKATKKTSKKASKKKTRSSSQDDDDDKPAKRTRKAEPVKRTSVILVNAIDEDEKRVAVVENGLIQDFQMTVQSQNSMVNDIYRGRVVNLEPAIGAAFVDFGQGRNGFLHTSDVLTAYGEKDWSLDKLLSLRLEPDEWGEKEGRSVADEFKDDEEPKSGSSKGGARGRGRKTRSRARPRLPITSLVKKGGQVVVQVTKEAIGDKGPTLTTYISIPGRYLVLMPTIARVGVSRKIDDEKERKRLKRILQSVDIPDGMGVIVRTAGIGRKKADIQRDLDYLLHAWENLKRKLGRGHGPAPLYLESDVAIRTMRDLFNEKTEAVYCDSPEIYEQIVEFTKRLMPDEVHRIKMHEGNRPLFHTHSVEQDFERIFSRRVELPSGGSIVFDQTEALVAIDVNSGKTRTDGFDFEEIALKTNLEAVPEIARQIRLRDLGGIIVIDFIDMMRQGNMRSVERAFRQALADDRARSKIGRISQFGLLELTRQRLGPGMTKKLFHPCPHCRGTGRVRNIESRAQAILRRLGSALTLKGFSKVEVRAVPEVIDYLKRHCEDELKALEHRFERKLLYTGVPDQTEDSVLRYLRADGREVRPGGRRKR